MADKHRFFQVNGLNSLDDSFTLIMMPLAAFLPVLKETGLYHEIIFGVAVRAVEQTVPVNDVDEYRVLVTAVQEAFQPRIVFGIIAISAVHPRPSFSPLRNVPAFIVSPSAVNQQARPSS